MKPPKRILIAYDDEYQIAFELAKQFEQLSISTNIFVPNKTEHWINKYFFRKINKLLRNLRLVPKGTDLFSWSQLSYTKYLESQFDKRILEFNPDLILCIHGQRFGEKILNKYQVPKIGWWIEPDPDQQSLIRFAKLFDLYFSYDSQVVDFLNMCGIRSEYQSHVTSPAIFFPLPNQNKEIDILFYGNWSPWREEVLFSAYQVSKNIALYGNNWLKKCTLFSKKDLLDIYKDTEVIGSNLNTLINSSKMILGAQRLKGLTTGLDTRFFDVLASGNLLVTDAPLDLIKHFNHQENLLIYKNPDELQSLIKEIINDERSFEEIKQCGKNHVIQNYTYKHLCSRIITN